MLQIAIVEDEADLAQQTKDNVVRYLNEHGLEGNIAVFNDGMDIAENYKPIWDILLLDIEMPLLDGMSAAQKIRELDATVVMIFITRMAKYAIKGYEVAQYEIGYDLTVIEEFMPISARFIANKASYKFKYAQLTELLNKMKEALAK